MGFLNNINLMGYLRYIIIPSLIVSLAINDVDPNWRIGCVTLFSCDTVLGFIELIVKKKKKNFRVAQEKNQTIESKVHSAFFYFFHYLVNGEGFALVTLFCMQALFDPWYSTMFNVFIYRDSYLFFHSLEIILCFICYKNCSGCNGFNGKFFVNMVYDFTFGFCSIYFSPIANIIIIYIFLRKYCKFP